MENYVITIMRGESFLLTVVLKKGEEIMDLTGYTAESQIRNRPDDAELIETIECAVDEENGKIIMSLSDDQTQTLDKDCYVYDLRLIDPDGMIKYLIGGKFIVFPSVTKNAD